MTQKAVNLGNLAQEVTEDENINSRQGYFLGGPVVRNPLAIAGDMDSPPDRERSHMLWDN